MINCIVAGLGSSGQDHDGNGFRTESDKILMSDERYRTLMVKKGQLCRFIDTESRLLDQLLSAEVISPGDENDIRCIPDDNQKARKLIEILATKDDDAFDVFIKALSETGQAHVIYILTGEENSRHQNEDGKSVPMSEEHCRAPVSYTHLTLPTIYSV